MLTYPVVGPTDIVSVDYVATAMHMQQEVLCTYCVHLYYRKGMYFVLSSDVVVVERLPRLGLVLDFLVDTT